MNPNNSLQEQPSEESLISVYRVTVTFDKKKVLESIAEKLLNDGLISGFTVSPVHAGYVNRGSMAVGRQYQLIIFVTDASTARQLVGKLHELIKKEGWETSDANFDKVNVHPDMLKYIQKAGEEYKKYKRAKRVNCIMKCVMAGVIAITASISVMQYGTMKMAEGENAALKKSYDDLHCLERKIEEQIFGNNGLMHRLRYGSIGTDNNGEDILGWQMQQVKGDRMPIEFGEVWPDQIATIAHEIRHAKTNAMRDLHNNGNN